MFSGKYVTVRAFSESDIDTIRKWQNIPGPGPAFMGNIAPRPLSGSPELFRVPWVKNLVIESTAEKKPIGVARIDHVRPDDRHAALFYEIGDKSYLTKPHTEEGLRLTLDYLFKKINLGRVYTYAMDYEPAMIALLEKVGFQREVTLRDRVFYAGAFHPVYVYGLLAEEVTHA